MQCDRQTNHIVELEQQQARMVRAHQDDLDRLQQRLDDSAVC